jgi:hypothetical protein
MARMREDRNAGESRQGADGRGEQNEADVVLDKKGRDKVAHAEAH